MNLYQTSENSIMIPIIHTIDNVAIEQSSKRKTSSDTIYHIQELMEKIEIQDKEIKIMKEQMNIFEKKNNIHEKIKPGPDPKKLPIYQ